MGADAGRRPNFSRKGALSLKLECIKKIKAHKWFADLKWLTKKTQGCVSADDLPELIG